MKSLINSFVTLAMVFSFLVLFPGFVHAQMAALNKSEVPPGVLKAIETDFPNLDPSKIEWYSYDQNMEDWAPVNDPSEHYVVRATGKDYKMRAVYDGTGKLLYSKATVKNTALPSSILDNIEGGQYKGWAVVGDQEVIRDFSQNKKYFRVNLESQGKKAVLYFDHLGNQMSHKG